MSFNPDKDNGTKINYKNINEVVQKIANKKYIAYEWTSKGNFSKIEKETEIEPGLAAHEMIERIMDPINQGVKTFYGNNTRMLTLNQRNTYIKEQAEKLKEKAEEYMEQAKQAQEEAAKAAEEAAKAASIPEPEEPKGE